MKKINQNLLLDAVLYLLMLLEISTGLLIKYTLLPGREAWAVYGRRVELLFWGMDRHQWGNIHLYIGFGIVFLLVLHILLHWRMLLGALRALLGSSPWRKLLFLLLLLLTLLFLIAPFRVRPEVRERRHGRGDAVSMREGNYAEPEDSRRGSS